MNLEQALHQLFDIASGTKMERNGDLFFQGFLPRDLHRAGRFYMAEGCMRKWRLL